MSRVCFVHVTAIKLKTLMEGSLTRTGTTTTKSHGQTCTDKARLSKTDAATAAASQESLHGVDLCCGGAPPACSVLMQWSFGAASVLLMLFARAREERLLLLFVRAREERLLLLFVRAREERAGGDGRGVEPNPAARLASAAANGRSSDRHFHRHGPAATIERECRAPLVGALAGLKGCAA